MAKADQSHLCCSPAPPLSLPLFRFTDIQLRKKPLFAKTVTTWCGLALWSDWGGPAAQAQSLKHLLWGSGFYGIRARKSRMQEQLFPKSLLLNSCYWRNRLEKSHMWSTVKLSVNRKIEDLSISSWRFIKVLFLSPCVIGIWGQRGEEEEEGEFGVRIMLRYISLG